MPISLLSWHVKTNPNILTLSVSGKGPFSIWIFLVPWFTIYEFIQTFWQHQVYIHVQSSMELQVVVPPEIFSRMLNNEQPWTMVSPSGSQGRLVTDSHKRFRFKLRYLSCNAIHCVCHCYTVLWLSPCGNCSSGNQWKKVMIFWLLLLLGISNPRVSCHLPASMKLWQAVLVALQVK